jgi:RHS repeat-associated protein
MYDEGGTRIAKIVKHAGTIEWEYTHYVRDVSGNVIATYEQIKIPTDDNVLILAEHTLYGSKRVGVIKQNIDLQQSISTGNGLITKTWDRRRGNKNYELANHLGNVINGVSDLKIRVGVSVNSTIVFSHYEADVRFASDYYPFGMQMKERTFAAQDYTYGFNGQEQDTELLGGAVSFKYRIHDPRIGRFLSVDPLAPQYPWYTPYQFAGNKVIACAELEGLEEVQKIKVDDGTYVENRGGNSANIHVYDSENQEWAKYNVAYAVVSAKSLEGARTVPTKAIQQGRYVVRVQSYGNPTEFGMRPNELGTPTKPKYNANASAAQHALGDLRGDFLSTSARTKWGFPVKAELFTGPEWYIDVNKSLAYTNGKLLGVEDVVSIMRAEGVSEERITSWLSQQAAKGGGT